jgi:hypothetical protein
MFLTTVGLAVGHFVGHAVGHGEQHVEVEQLVHWALVVDGHVLAAH